MGRLTLTREFYVSPQAKEAGPLDLGGAGADATIYSWEEERDGKPRFYALAFHGNAAKPDIHGYFRKEENRRSALADYLSRRRHHATRNTERKQERSMPHSLKVGDILDASWGYEQTNIDFYEVTRVLGGHFVEIREIAQNRTDTGFMQGDCTPQPGHYIGTPERHKADATNHVKVRDFGVWASPWMGGTRHWTAYA